MSKSRWVPTLMLWAMWPSPGLAEHPLDPLSAEEIAAAVEVLKRAGKVTEATRFPILQLREPPKEFVRHWREGRPVPRMAFVEVKDGPALHEAVVDVRRGRLIAWRRVRGQQPPILLGEFFVAQAVALSSPEFRHALARRGVTNLDSLICFPLSAGYFGDPAEEGRRLLRTTCVVYDQNPWPHPVENLHAVVDLDRRSVLRVVDGGVAPVPSVDANYPPPPRPPLPPLLEQQPDGPGFRVSGNLVTWDRWRFHFRIEQREGLVVSLVERLDDADPRSLLYKGSLAEIFVPYADPSSNWYYRTFMDEGEYGLGKNLQPLVPGSDCPAHAARFDVTLADDLGGAFTVPGGVCLFERTPHLLWKHFDIFSFTEEGRAGRELVLRAAYIVGNYDYFHEWVFRQDGAVDVRLGAGGILEFKAVASASTGDATHAVDTRHGTLLDTHLVAPFHQHLFNLRLDLDVDGPDNSVAELTPTVVPVTGSPRKSAWVLKERVFERELEARRRSQEGSLWVVRHSHRRNRVGQPVAYALEVGHAPELLMLPQDPPFKRASFAGYGLWVTRHSAREQYAAGDYPNQNPGGDGLPRFVADDDAIRDRDVVLWVNLGTTHVPRAEDYPVMPTEWFGSVRLMPFNFFDRNPALDLPRP